MKRMIVGFVQDDVGDWVAQLDCPLCDRDELPDNVDVVRTTDTWNERTMPAGLRRAHPVASGTWARLRVEVGELRFRAHTEPAIDTTVGPHASQAIPPGVEHEIEPLGRPGRPRR